MLLEIEGLASHYGRIQALRGLSLQIAEGELVALVGANGAGKTTLVRVVAGVQPASAGSVRFETREITRLDPSQRVRLGIAMVPEGRQVFAPLTVEDNLRLGGITRPAREAATTLAEVYDFLPMLAAKKDAPAGTLSGGQQQMLAIGRALMSRPRLLLLDEPSMGLAPLLVEEIFTSIRRLKAGGATIFLVEQNAHAALAIADRAYVLETGSVAMSGTGRALLEDERVKTAYLGI
jgi:branched-chain amino acid transport system ATP-binding protein